MRPIRHRDKQRGAFANASPDAVSPSRNVARNRTAQRRSGKGQRGVTFLEVLVAACILTTCLAVMISLWAFSFNMTVKTNDKAIGYNLARQTLEWIQATGFYNTVEAPASAPIVHYFDSSSTNRDSQQTQARYKVTTTVISDYTVSGSNPVQPATNALRAVTVTVTLVSTGQQLYQTVTYLARGGV